MGNPWFRMYHEFATDPKVQMLSEVDQRRFIMLLCLRCSNDDVTLHDDEIAFQLRISSEEFLETKRRLMAKELIDESCQPIAWEKRQFSSDSSTVRVKAYRDKKKTEVKRQGNVTETKGNALDTDTDTDTDTDKEEPKGSIIVADSGESSGSVPDEKPKPSRKQKTPDGVDEVFDYWKSVMGKTGQTVLDGKRKARIVWALGQYGVETSKRAIDGCKDSAWHMGENDKGQRYDDLTLIFRDASKVENFLEIANAPPKTNLVAVNGGKAIPTMSKLNQTNAANIQAWLDRDRSAE